MSGFDDLVEIFRGGKQTDSQGREHDGDALIDKAVAAFDVAKHEPPVVVGHPVENGPALGWVKGLTAKVEDGVKVLYAKMDQVVPAFADAVKAGMFKKRSAAFYPDGSLRHVGFLGAMPPAVKGLMDMKFEGEKVFDTFEFSDPAMLPENNTAADAEKGKSMKTIKEVIEAIKGLTFSDAERSELLAALPTIPVKPVTFSEADIEKAKAEARKEAAAEFAEAKRKETIETRKKDATEFLDGLIKQGKAIPAWKDAGLGKVLEFLACSTDVIEFSEGKRADHLEITKGILSGLPKLIDFSEFAKRSGAGGDAAQTATDRIMVMTKKIVDDSGGKITFGEAMRTVCKENATLYQEYTLEMATK